MEPILQTSLLHNLQDISQCLLRDWLAIPECKQKMTSLRGQASSAKMTSLGVKGLFTRLISEHNFAVS
jgi:hypothetical protein